MDATCPQHTGTADRAGTCYRCAARRHWHATSQRTRDDVDELLRRRRTMAALVRLRQDTSAGAPRALDEALDTALERAHWLDARGEVDAPPPAPSVDEMVATARAAQAPVRVVEMVWDGDSAGWIEDLVAIVERPSSHHARYDEVPLWACRGGNAVEVGKEVAERLGVEFHAAQPDAPDIGLPRWWDRG